MSGGGSANQEFPALKRLPSGIAGLDEILQGGFIRNNLYIVQGKPGAGKTIFGNQVCYADVAAGGRAIYVTMLSEQHERMLSNLEQLSFFDQSCIAESLTYVSAFQLLERDGLAGLLTLLRREIVGFRADVLVLDGLLASEAHASSELQLKKFVHELQMLAAACDCTMFLLTSGKGALVSPEHTMVDGMIEIGDETIGWRTERYIAIRKFRGSAHLRGRHAMRITSDGIVVWPRIEAMLDAPETLVRVAGEQRVSTGSAALDAMMGGGLPRASTTLVLGPPGAGKTTLGLQFLAGCTPEAPGLLLGFYEAPAQILARAEILAPALPGLVRGDVVELSWQLPCEDLIDRVAHELLTAIRRRGVRRLVIDGLLGLRDMTVQPERLPILYRALSNQLRGLGVTVMCTMEVPELIGVAPRAPLSELTPIAENLILLRHVEREGRLERVLSIMKVRDSDFDHRLRPYSLGQGGLLLNGSPGRRQEA